MCFPLYVEVDEIYNLACPASPIHYQHDPVQTTKTSVIGAINMLGLAKRLKAKILQASTSEVYGDPIVHPQTEELLGQRQPDRRRAPATTKASAAPRRCSSTTGGSTISTSRWRGSSTPMGRACTRTTGAWCPTSSSRRCDNQDITLYGDGSQTRSFCYVDDLVDGLIRFMATPHDVTGPINLGNPGEFTIRQLAETIIRLTNSSSRITFKPLPEDDPKQRQPDLMRAKAILGWQPTTQLHEGLRMAINHFRMVLGMASDGHDPGQAGAARPPGLPSGLDGSMGSGAFVCARESGFSGSNQTD